MSVTNSQPSEAQVGDLSEHIGFEMGSAAGLYKFACDVAPYNQQLAELIVSNLTPDHRTLLADLQPPQQQ